jgi:hypothetical protein
MRHGIGNAALTALLVVALLVSLVVAINFVVDPVDHDLLDARLIVVEDLMEQVVCLLEAGSERSPSEIAACRVG